MRRREGSSQFAFMHTHADFIDSDRCGQSGDGLAAAIVANHEVVRQVGWDFVVLATVARSSAA